MITSIYAAILGLILAGLSINVVKARRRFGAGIGDADKIEMKRCIRAQANLVEYAPMFLILLACAEYNQLSKWILHIFGIVFLVGRVMHAYSLLKAEEYSNYKLVNNPIWRISGMICTFSAIALLSVIILIQRIT